MLPGEELAGLGHNDGVNFANAIERPKGITVNTLAEDLTSLDIVNEAIDENSTKFYQTDDSTPKATSRSGSVISQGLFPRQDKGNWRGAY